MRELLTRLKLRNAAALDQMNTMLKQGKPLIERLANREAAEVLDELGCEAFTKLIGALAIAWMRQTVHNDIDEYLEGDDGGAA